jgi:putative oxidoreductase
MLGALTPFATTALTATMVTAIRKVHAAKGPWVTGGGYEYNLVLIAALTALAEHGPGRPSVDGDRFRGPFWALASLGAGVAGSYLATSPPVNEEPDREPTGRFTRETERVPA